MTEKLQSKTAFVAELAPHGRKLVEFSIELANTPGNLAKAASILSKHKVNVLTGFHDTGKWSFFADVTEIESSVDEIVKEISSLESVRKISRSEGVSEDFIVDSLHQQITWGPFRSILMRAEVMSSILVRVKGIFGAEGKAGKAMVYGMGEASGRTAYVGIASAIGAETIRSRIQDLLRMYTAQGWGDFRLISVDFNQMTASVTVVDSFECAHIQKPGSPSSTFTCDFIRGHLAGGFSEAFGKRVEATETLCTTRGHSHCQFEFIPSTTATTFAKAFTN